MATPRRSRRRPAGTAPIWTRDFVLATLTNLLLSIIFMASIVTMAPYAVEHLGATEPQAGAVASIFVVGALVFRPLAGRLLDVIGRRRLVVVGIAVQVAILVLYFVADSLALLLAVRVLHGMVFGVVNTALAASVISMLPARRRSEGTGYFGMSGVIAGALGPLAALPVLNGPGPTALFGLFTGSAAFALVLALFLRLPSPQPPGPPPATSAHSGPPATSAPSGSPATSAHSGPPATSAPSAPPATPPATPRRHRLAVAHPARSPLVPPLPRPLSPGRPPRPPPPGHLPRPPSPGRPPRPPPPARLRRRRPPLAGTASPSAACCAPSWNRG